MDKGDYIPVKNIAENIRVSEKTVYRELKTIEDYLNSKYIFLEKRPGTGIKLNITKEQKSPKTSSFRGFFNHLYEFYT